MRTVLRIIRFHNCDGCARKIRLALRKFHGLQLVEIDRETGNVTVSTAEHPEVIRHALQRQMKKPVVIVSTYQNPNSVASSSIVPPQRTLDIQGLGETVLGMIQGLDGVEITRTDAIRVNFIRRENPAVVRAEPRANTSSYGGVRIEEADVEHAPRRPTTRAPPWPVAEPSAPLMSAEEEEVHVYGHPPEFYGFSATDHIHSHERADACCNIM